MKRVMHCCRASVSGDPHCSSSQLMSVAISATFRPLGGKERKITEMELGLGKREK